MTMTSLFRAAVLSLALMGGVSGAMPAQAAGPHVTFGFGFGMDPFNDNHRGFCLPRTDYQLRKAVAAKGYSNIYLNSPIHREIQVRATKGEWVYLMQVSICTGEILERKRLRHA